MRLIAFACLLAACETATTPDGGSDLGAARDLISSGADLTAADTLSAPDLAPYPDPLAGVGSPTRVGASSYQFTEGPVWRASEGVLLFSDITPNLIYSYTPPSAPTVFRMSSGGANGNAIDPQGLLVTCEGGNHRVTRTLGSGMVVELAGSYMGKKLNSPNDVIVRSDGTIYFTDPDYGGAIPTDKQPFEGVFRISPQGILTAEDTTLARPNGIALSPDEKTLYVADEARSLLWRYDVAGDGSLSGGAKLVDTALNPDGIAIDDAGNIYVATAAGIEVYRTDKSRIGVIAVAEQPTNCTFGGADRRTLYITAQKSLYEIRLNVPGKP